MIGQSWLCRLRYYQQLVTFYPVYQVRYWWLFRVLRRVPAHFVNQGFLFIHIPKTGGQSLNAALNRALGYPEDYYWHPGAMHVPLRFYRSALGERLAQLFVFTIVRHPVQRLYSTYHFLRKRRRRVWGCDWMWWLTSVRYPTFEEFVLRWVTEWRMRTRMGLMEFLWPQWWFLAYSPRGPIAVDFVLRQERLDADYQRLRELLAERCGVLLPETLPRKNITPGKRRLRPGDLPRSVIDRIYQLYEADFKLLGYEPEVF